MKKAITTIIIVVVLVISICIGWGWRDAYNSDATKGIDNPNHGTKYFGSYPQTKVTDKEIIAALGTFDSSTWISYGYYVEGEVSDCMYYIDKTYNGEKYRGVYIVSTRPDCADYATRMYEPQLFNAYFPTSLYWFKYEPIKWDIVKEENGKAILVADLILDSQPFDYEGYGEYSNNYAESTIRKWLNGTFYNTAFSEAEKEIILTTSVDNSVASMEHLDNPYFCVDTYDKIFLLSYVEAATYYTNDNERIKTGSNYARSQGLLVDTAWWRYNVDSEWWLRSPGSQKGMAESVHYKGTDSGGFCYDTSWGVVPALQIQI